MLWRPNSASMAKTSSTGITARLTHRTIVARVTIRYPVMQVLLPMRAVDELDGVGDRTCHWSAIITLLPSCSPRYPYTPEAILIVRDFTQRETAISLSTFQERQISASARGLERELLAGDQVSPGRLDPKNAPLPSQPPDPRF
jgi:hypothetical protein